MITVFTATYNRAYILPKLYESLKRQTSKSFEWIVIDDDSSDETGKLMNNYVSETKDFEIRYEKQIHGGKHRAFNKAVKMAKYDWFLCIDSDDYLSDNAIEKVLHWIKINKEDEKIGVISASRFDLDKNQPLSVPNILKNNPGLKCFNYERSKFGLNLDRAEVYRTDLLKLHPFPEYENEFFCTEAVVGEQIALEGFYTVFYPDAIRIGSFLSDGLTKTGANGYSGFYKNFYGFLDYVKVEISAYGVCSQTYYLLRWMLKIARNKKISDSTLCKRTNLEINDLKNIRKNRFCYFLFRVFKRLSNVFEKKLRNFGEAK